MFDSVRIRASAVLTQHPWMAQLAGILPLSALVDFIELPRTLHISQLTGGIPLWCWPVTPLGSRVLLKKGADRGPCVLDRYGTSTNHPLCLDGRFGDSYHMSNPETVRMCMDATTCTNIMNLHRNMDRSDVRPHTLSIVAIDRAKIKNDNESTHSTESKSWTRHKGLSIFYVFSSVSGWMLLLSLLVTSIVLHCYLNIAFLIVVPLTGLTISLYYNHRSNRLLRETPPGTHKRVIVAADHTNTLKWTVFYGKSTLLNSFLNWPLRRERPGGTITGLQPLLRLLLRFLVVGQWALAIAAACTQTWDAYIISFWVIFCIFAQTFLFTAERNAAHWMRDIVGISMRRFETKTSTRRAFLSTVMALNPDTFHSGDKYDQRIVRSEGVLWMDSILKECAARSRWEEAMKNAIIEANAQKSGDEETGARPDWRTGYAERWNISFIEEGIEVSDEIKRSLKH